jgi:hypothetical protein
MKYVRFVLGIIVGMLMITIIAEGIEFLIVKLVSGKTFEYLQSNQDEYFSFRNRNWILVFKILYSLIAGIIGGYLTAWISKGLAKIAIYFLLLIQSTSLIWGGFISEWSTTGPIWMWLYLIFVIPLGIWIGYKWKSKNALQQW